MHKRALLLLPLLLAGCGPSFEEEYKAAQLEIQSLQLQLSNLQNKLKAADNEVRHKIFTQARRANSFLQATNIDTTELGRLQQELAVHLTSYQQLNGNQDQVALVARFYTDKLETILQLKRDANRAYDRQYTSCLTDLDGEGKKNQLSTMLCEVQADVARKKPNDLFDASVQAMLNVGTELLNSGRQDGIATLSADQVEQRFTSVRDEALKKIQG